MDLHPQVAHYVTLMRSRWAWYGTDDPANKTYSQRLNIFYTKIRWILHIGTTITLAATLNRVDSFGLYDGTFAYFPFSLIMSILITLTTFTGTQQQHLTSRFSHCFIHHNELWMEEIRNRYLGILLKFMKIFWIYTSTVIGSYVLVPFVANIVLHYGFGYLTSPFILPGHFSPLFDRIVKWDYKYFLILAFNAWAITDQIVALQSLVATYSVLTTFLLTELDIFDTQLKSLDDADYADQREVDERYKLVILFHCDVVRLNEDLKKYFGLLGAIVSVFATINITLCSFTISTSSNIVLVVAYGSGMIMFFFWSSLYCYLGQRMENKSDDIFRSVYNLRWYEFSPEVRKSINMILRQARTPLTVDYHGRFQMNFNNFKQIMRNSYSFFTLLQSVAT